MAAHNSRICAVGAGLDETSEVDQIGGYLRAGADQRLLRTVI
jgi:hypothetical protein